MKNQEKTELTFEKKPQSFRTGSQCTNGNGTALSAEWTRSKTQQNNFPVSGREQLIVEIRETNLLLWRRTLLIIKFWSITTGSQGLSARMFHLRNPKEAPDTKPWVVRTVIQLAQSITTSSIFSGCYYWFMKQQLCLPVCLCMRAWINGILHSPAFPMAPKGMGRQLLKVTGKVRRTMRIWRGKRDAQGWQDNVLVLCHGEQQLPCPRTWWLFGWLSYNLQHKGQVHQTSTDPCVSPTGVGL